MLSDKEKQKIRLEEEYRFEIRKELESTSKPKRWYAILWSGLNSSFTIFVLGSVILAAITNTIETRRQESVAEAAKVERAGALVTEVSLRITDIQRKRLLSSKRAVAVYYSKQ